MNRATLAVVVTPSARLLGGFPYVLPDSAESRRNPVPRRRRHPVLRRALAGSLEPAPPRRGGARAGRARKGLGRLPDPAFRIHRRGFWPPPGLGEFPGVSPRTPALGRRGDFFPPFRNF